VAGPTLAQTLTAQSNINGDTTTLTAALTSVSVGDVVIVKAMTWDTGVASGTPSGGSQTYTLRVSVAPGGFAGYMAIFSATMAAGVSSSFTLTLSAPASSVQHSMVVERWTSAQLAATPATSSGHYTSVSAPSATITTVAANSAVSWGVNDQSNVSTSSDAYISPAGTPEFTIDGSASNSGEYRYNQQLAASAGSVTYGMTAPTTQDWVMAAIEVQVSTGTTALPPPPYLVRQATRRAATY